MGIGSAGFEKRKVEKVKALKVVAIGAVAALCLSISTLVFSYIYFETSWFRDTVILQCDGDKYGANFALVVDTQNGEVLFEGRRDGEEETKREIVRFTDTQIGMQWELSDGKTTHLWISRVNNSMQMWRELESGELDDSLEKVNGKCYLTSASF
jgi:hypothetical protein